MSANIRPLGISCHAGHFDSWESQLGMTVDCVHLLGAYIAPSGSKKIKSQEESF